MYPVFQFICILWLRGWSQLRLIGPLLSSIGWFSEGLISNITITYANSDADNVAGLIRSANVKNLFNNCYIMNS